MKLVKYKIAGIFTLLTLNIFVAKAQDLNVFKVSGRFSDQNGQSIGYAMVSLLKANDSSLVKGTISSDTGTFAMGRIAPGKYIVKGNAIGYTQVSSAVFELSVAHPTFNVPELILKTSDRSLATVTVSAIKPVIERKIDRTIVNVENSILSAGNSALEILARVPGVRIDKDDNISLNGKQGVNVMINGKVTYLSAAELGTLLRSTDGNSIKSIELITNPSAKYDASGNAGIINIKLKKNTQAGTNGTVVAGAGYGNYGKENSTFSLNHKQGNLNIFTSLSHSDSKTEFDLNQQRVVKDSTGASTYFVQQSKAIRISHNNSYRFGADLETSSKNTVGFLANGYLNTSSSQGNSITDIGQQSGLINSYQDQSSTKSNNNKNFSLNLNDNLKLDTLGQLLSIDLDYSRFNNQSDNQYNTNFYLPNGSTSADPIFFRQQTPSLINIRTAKADYTLLLDKNTKLEAGAKYSDVKTDNILNAQSLQNGIYINDSTLTNRFIYDEKIAAGYLNLNRTFYNTTVGAGLRAEHTSSDGDLINGNNKVKKSYLDFFPSIFVNQKINDKNELEFSYSKRVDRPEYSNLNPFIYYLDQYSYTKGNPFLNPQYTNKVELSYTYNRSLNLAFGYSHTYNYIAFLPLTDPKTKITEYTTINLQHQNYYYISANSPYSFTKWWAGNINAVTFYSSFKADSLLGANYDRGRLSLHLQATQYLHIAKTYKAEVVTNYDSPLIDGAYNYGHTIYSDFGLSHAFANKKANLKFSVTDIFNTNRTTMASNFQTNDILLHLKSESRVARLTLTYNFGDSSIKSRKHSSGAMDEKSRV